MNRKILSTSIAALAISTAITWDHPAAAQDRGGRDPIGRLMSLDKNDDGKLTVDEVGDRRLTPLLRRANRDGDNEVTRDELERLVGEFRDNPNGNRPARGAQGRSGESMNGEAPNRAEPPRDRDRQDGASRNEERGEAERRRSDLRDSERRNSERGDGEGRGGDDRSGDRPERDELDRGLRDRPAGPPGASGGRPDFGPRGQLSPRDGSGPRGEAGSLSTFGPRGDFGPPGEPRPRGGSDPREEGGRPRGFNPAGGPAQTRPEDRPRFPFGGPGAGMQPGQILPPPVVEQLGLSELQREALEQLQEEVQRGLRRILTADQARQLEQRMPRPPMRENDR